MNFLKTYYLNVFKNSYFNLEGRAGRKQYWLFFLFNFIVLFVLLQLTTVGEVIGMMALVLYALYGLAVLLPLISIGVRRLHDAGFCGWWILLGLLPLLGQIPLLVMLVLPSTPGPNRFDK